MVNILRQSYIVHSNFLHINGMLFYGTHKHTPHKCWEFGTFIETKTCYAGPISQNALGKTLRPDFQKENWITFPSVLIDGSSQTLFIVKAAQDRQMAFAFLNPLQDSGSADVVPVSDHTQLHEEIKPLGDTLHQSRI